MDISPWSPSDLTADTASPWIDGIDVPHYLGTLPDGTDTIVIGDVTGFSDLAHPQGENIFGFEGTCGLCACQDVLHQFGRAVSENDMVLHAVENAQCLVSDAPAFAGGTAAETQAELLADYGIPAHVEHAGSLEDLAVEIEQDRGMIAEVNYGLLWDNDAAVEDGGADHAITVTAVSRNPLTGELQGFYVNDSNPGVGGRFVHADTMELAWLGTGGEYVTTDVTRADTATLTGRTA